MHEHGARRPGEPGIEVVADDQVAHAGTGEHRRHGRRADAGVEPDPDGIEQPRQAWGAQRHRIADGVRGAGEGLERIVERSAPGVLPEAAGRNNQRTSTRGMVVDPVRRRRPPGGQGVVPAAGHQLPCQRGARGPHQPDREHPRQQRAGAARGGQPEQVTQPQGDGKTQERIELVHVAERRQRSVEQGPDVRVQQAVKRAGVTRGHRQQAKCRGCNEATSTVEAPSHQARHPEQRHDRGDQHDAPVGDQRPARPPPRLAADSDVAQPVARPAQHLRHGGGAGRGGGRLDEVQERRGVATLQHERHEPPRAGQRDRHDPPTGQSPARGASQPRQQPQARQGQQGEHSRGVDGTHAQHRHARAHRCPARSLLGCLTDERDQHPGQEGHGKDLGGVPTDLGEHARRERVEQASEQPGVRGAEVQSGAQSQHAEERGHQQQRHPRPLNHPRRHLQPRPEQVEGTHRPQVAVRLVLQLSERRARVPQVQGSPQEPAGVSREVELGVIADQPGALVERDDHEQQADRGLSQPQDGVSHGSPGAGTPTGRWPAG